jgi:hypothetical protein
VVEFTLVVAPAGFAATGGGSSGEVVLDPSNPNYIPPSGSSSGSGKRAGYLNPVTGLTYSDPAGTQVCGNCSTDTSNQVNTTQTTDTPSTNETTSTETTSTTSSSSP